MPVIEFKTNRNKFERQANRVSRRRPMALLGTLALAAALGAIMIIGPVVGAGAASISAPGIDVDQNKRRVPDFDINLASYVAHAPSTAQLQALAALKVSLADNNITARWDKASGSVDTIYDFASAPSSLDPEAAARAFIAGNAALFGISDMNTLSLDRNVAALGGNLLYFKQVYNGLPVSGSGIGVVMDGQRRVKMVSGPYQANLSLTTAPSLDGAAAVAAAQTGWTLTSIRQTPPSPKS